MASKDLVHSLSSANTLVPATRNANGDGTTVDLQGFESAMITAMVGAIADGAHSLTVQESDDGIAWTDVAATDLQGAFIALAANSVQEVGYIGGKRYIRVHNVSGGAAGATFGVAVVRGHARSRPV